MNTRTSKLARIGVLSAAAFVVMMIETPPVFSTFLKMDFSDVIALIGGFALGPLAGVAIQAIKNILHLMISQTMGIGELGNFIVGATFVYVASVIYHRGHTKKQALRGLVIASVAMIIMAMIANYLILLPLYAVVLGFTVEAIVELTHAVNPLVTDKMSFIIFAIVPFNLLKSVILSMVAYLAYESAQRMLHIEQDFQ